jgi:hypothetical protein
MSKLLSTKYLLNIVFLLLNLGLAVFAFFFLFEVVAKDSQNLFEVKKDIVLLEEKKANFNTLKEDYQNHQKEIGEIDRLFIDAEAPIDFIEFLENISVASGLKIKITPGVAVKIKGDVWPSVNFQISGEGEASEILKFTEKLENGPYLLRISGFNLNKPEKSEKAEVSLVIRVYTNPVGN